MEKSLLMNLGAAYPNIRSLQIHQPHSHTENPKKSKRDLGMKPTLERELHALAHDVVVQHHFRHLQHLRINSAFSNTQPGKGIDAVVSILKACPNLISCNWMRTAWGMLELNGYSPRPYSDCKNSVYVKTTLLIMDVDYYVKLLKNVLMP